jgi:hypothetical protein
MSVSLRIAREGAESSLDQEICYKIAATYEERSAAFRLLYSSYLRAGLIDANPFETRVTPYHLLATTDVFVASMWDEVIATMSLVGDGELGLPMEHIYAEEVDRLRQRGLRIGEVSALADRRRRLSRTLPVFVGLARLMIQTARERGLQQVLVAVHPRHARFYQRMLSFEPLGEERSYPLVCNNPAVALSLDFARIDRLRPENHDTFFAEQIPKEQLRPQTISAEEIERFLPAARWSGGFTPVGPDDHSSHETLGNCA